MSAPQTAYSANTFELHNVGVVKYDNLIALKLLEYGDEIKSLFHLDLLFIVQNGSDVGFIGCIQTGGFNSIMHNSSRVGKGRLKRSIDGVEFTILNDAGLNTLTRSTSALNEVYALAGVTVSVTNLASYYSNTSNFGL